MKRLVVVRAADSSPEVIERELLASLTDAEVRWMPPHPLIAPKSAFLIDADTYSTQKFGEEWRKPFADEWDTLSKTPV